MDSHNLVLKLWRTVVGTGDWYDLVLLFGLQFIRQLPEEPEWFESPLMNVAVVIITARALNFTYAKIPFQGNKEGVALIAIALLNYLFIQDWLSYNQPEADPSDPSTLVPLALWSIPLSLFFLSYLRIVISGLVLLYLKVNHLNIEGNQAFMALIKTPTSTPKPNVHPPQSPSPNQTELTRHESQHGRDDLNQFDER